jgi:hypothetical protein
MAERAPDGTEMRRAVAERNSAISTRRCSFLLFAGLGSLIAYCQDCAGSRIYVMNLFAHYADDRLVGVGILRHVIGGKALNSMLGLWTTIYEKWHCNARLRWSRGSDPGLLRLTMDGAT